MKRFLKSVIAASSLLAVMGLVGCGGNNASKDKLLEEIKGLNAETDESVINELKIVNADGIYGNVHLPTTIGEKEVTWWSSDSAVINPKADGSIAPGAVERQSKDMTIKLAAKIGSGASATKYEQEVIVKAAPKELEDNDFEAYLFAHFVGESYGKTEDGVKIATGEQMFFALADVGQGLKFKDMNGSTMSNLKPVLSSTVGERGVRDPFICRSPEGDTFYLIATDLSIYTRGGWGMDNAGAATKTGSHSIILWESHDLVNWTEGRQIPVARDDAGMAWAPEMIYREETGEYLIFFSSTILDDYGKGKNANIIYRDSVYYTATRDFKHFSETKQFIPNIKYQDNITSRPESESNALNNDYRKVIDGSIIKVGEYYYSAAKDGGNNEEGGGIRIQKTKSLMPEIDDDGNEYIPWEFVQNLADVGFKAKGDNADNKALEGPEWFYFNKADRKDPDVDEIGLMADHYSDVSGYIPWATTDIEDINNANNSWRQLTSTEFSWDSQTKRHGTILRITADEAALLKENFPIA